MELLLQQKVSEVELVPFQVCARSSKFSLFDPAKEMAYIQMSRAEKRQGKAAVDLIGSQVRLSTPLNAPTHPARCSSLFAQQTTVFLAAQAQP